MLARQAVATVLRDQADAECDRIDGRADRDCVPVHRDGAGDLSPPGAEKRHGCLDHAGAEQPEQAERLAVPNRNIEMVH